MIKNHHRLKIHKQTWWDKNLPNSEIFEKFTGWLGDDSAPSRVWFIKYLKQNPNYSSILDVGCGTAIDYYAYFKNGINIKYTGVDSSVYLNKKNKNLGIEMIQAEAHNIPVKDSSYDISYSRHVLEHQPDFRPILKELIRSGSKLAVHIFYIKPGESESINYNSKENYWHNRYLKKNIEIFSLSFSKVKSCEWYDIDEKESILILNLK